MLSDVRQFLHILMAGILIAVLAVPTALLAQTHVVNPADLQKEMVAGSEVRQHNLDTVREFLSSPAAKKAMGSAHMNPVQVKTAVSTLSDAELAQLASRMDKARSDFAAGRLGDRDLLFILLGVAVLILLIVAIHD